MYLNIDKKIGNVIIYVKKMYLKIAKNSKALDFRIRGTQLLPELELSDTLRAPMYIIYIYMCILYINIYTYI